MSAIKLCSGVGKYHTNKNGGSLDAISWPEILAMVDTPPQVEKDSARWVIPSTLSSRVHKEQEENGTFYLHWLDIDQGNVPLERLIEAIKSIVGDVTVEIYSSRSAIPDNLKWRALLPTAKPLPGADWILAQECLNDALEAAGITPDRASERAGQPCYLPNRGALYQAHSKRGAPSLDALAVFNTTMAQKRAQLAADATELQQQREAAKARRESMNVKDAPDTIGAFNQAYSLVEILLRAGYDQRGNTFRHPNSESGSFSASVKDGRVHSLSSADPLYSDGAGAHDAFSAFEALFHQGNQNDALKDAGDNWLTVGGGSWNKAKQREYMEGNAEQQEQAGSERTGQQEYAGSTADAAKSPWPEPQPLISSHTPEAYPLDALPDRVRAAVEEVAGFVKAPVAMVASSALAALSLAIQAHADIKRADKLHGPTGLFLLTIADSGERKSTCDGFFTQAIRDYEAEQAEAAKPSQGRYRADLEAWEARRSGIKDKIRQLSKAGKPTAETEAALRDLEREKPEQPRVPRLMYADATPEALAHGLAKQWPSGGVVSAEAGIVFGSHGMNKDSVMRNMAMLNQLWDGTSLTVDRRTSDSFTVKGGRLTVALQVQEPTLREFFSKTGALARGIGFMARFLVAWPVSTQGTRRFTEAPDNWPALAAFNQRLTTILSQPAPIDEDGSLTPVMLPMSPDTKRLWVEYHDAIESELASGGELYDVRDVASKSADNAARLAALFQMFEHGTGAVSADCFESASRITAWHLSEARRFFGELALAPELVDVARLDSWLIEHCRRERTGTVNKRYLRQHGPVRNGAHLDSAIVELIELGRLRQCKEGRRIDLVLNPALLEANT